MSQYLLTVSKGEEAFVRKLLKNLPGVRVEKVKPKAPPVKKPLTPEQQEWVDDLKQSLVDVERHQRGEIELRTGQELLEELRAEHEKLWPSSR